MITMNELKRTVQEACARYAGNDRKARCRFTLATLDAAVLVERNLKHAARETACFHVISGSTVVPSMKIARMEFEYMFHRQDPGCG
jgi:hypothetical protein